MNSEKRSVEVVVLSDIHLGTYGCHADELLKYLKSIKPKTLILNGDIIDVWQFKKRFFPKSHLKVVKHFLALASKKTTVFYITGNHDETFRRFAGLSLGKLELVNDLTLTINGKKYWFFHGDIFDVIMKHSKWLAKLGAIGYDSLIYLNTFINWISSKFGKGKVSLSKTIKHSVKGAIKFINDFEIAASELAIKKKYDGIVCGHIHHPEIKTITTSKGKIKYLNSGDWIENLSALEYHKGKWSIYKFDTKKKSKFIPSHDEEHEIFNHKEIFNKLVDNMQN